MIGTSDINRNINARSCRSKITKFIRWRGNLSNSKSAKSAVESIDIYNSDCEVVEQPSDLIVLDDNLNSTSSSSTLIYRENNYNRNGRSSVSVTWAINEFEPSTWKPISSNTPNANSRICIKFEPEYIPIAGKSDTPLAKIVQTKSSRAQGYWYRNIYQRWANNISTRI